MAPVSRHLRDVVSLLTEALEAEGDEQRRQLYTHALDATAQVRPLRDRLERDRRERGGREACPVGLTRRHDTPI